MANLTSCHRDPKYWEHPETFDPEHFLDASGSFVEEKEGFMPYGWGKRRCPGEDLAEIEFFLIVTNLLKAFVFRAPQGDKKNLGTYYKSGTGILRNPKPFYVVLDNRDWNI